MNQPYIKKTKHEKLAVSYFHTEPNRRQRRSDMHTRPFNNRKGNRVRIFETLKYTEKKQIVSSERYKIVPYWPINKFRLEQFKSELSNSYSSCMAAESIIEEMVDTQDKYDRLAPISYNSFWVQRHSKFKTITHLTA